MPFGITHQAKEIGAYAAKVAEVAHDDLSKQLATLLVSAADELETISRFMFNVLGPDPSPPGAAAYKPFRHRDPELRPFRSAT